MTALDAPKILPLSDSAVLVEFGTTISAELNQKAIDLCSHFETYPFPGFIEAVPAYGSAAIFYDVVAVRHKRPSTAFDVIRSVVSAALDDLTLASPTDGREITIECRFGGDFGPDLGEVAARAGLPADEVVGIFSGQLYRVYMLGFLPGFAYMGEVDERIAMPRRSSPRARVQCGSVGIAGRQTGVYSLDSPGGWQIIGRTEMKMFLPDQDPPSRLLPGDVVRFRAV